MNEEELKKGCGKEIEENDKEVITCGNSLSYNGKLPNGRWKVFRFVLCPTCQAKLEGFQKGKLEQKKEELVFLAKLKPEKFTIMNFVLVINEMIRKIKKRIKQLQKEIGGMK